ncbi:MAG: NADH-quinone oxidoreductase subunit H [Nitrospirae bacterium]|nr:NADH-quinone oxidoreductase subunit H [Nitrospirota bacterium]
MILLAFIVPGIINKTKAKCAGRKGASILQPTIDIIKLLKKSAVISTSTSAVFILAPSITLASVLCAGLVVPIAGLKPILSFSGDLIFFAYILGIGRFFTIIAALDTASAFEGMGASREAAFSMFLEPSMFFVFGSLAMFTGVASFNEIFAILSSDAIPNDPGVILNIIDTLKSWIHPTNSMVVVVCSNIIILLAILVEASRMPFDDPNTHLELTMIHEVMVLDNSGPDLAMINIASSLKITVLASLITGLLIHNGHNSPVAALFLYIVFIVLVAIVIGLIESMVARIRLTHIPQYLIAASAIGITVFMIMIAGKMI